MASFRSHILRLHKPHVDLCVVAKQNGGFTSPDTWPQAEQSEDTQCLDMVLSVSREDKA